MKDYVERFSELIDDIVTNESKDYVNYFIRIMIDTIEDLEEVED